MPTILCEDMTDRLLYQRLEEAPKERKSLLRESEDNLAAMAGVSGVARVFEMEDGRIFARYNKAHGDAQVMYANREEAMNAFTSLRKNMSDRLKLEAKALRAGEAGYVVPPERPVSYADLDPGDPVRLDQLAHGERDASLDKPEGYITGKAWSRIQDLVSPMTRLNSIGPVSRYYASQLRRQFELTGDIQARRLLSLERAYKNVDDETVARWVSHIESKEPRSPEVQAAQEMLMREIGDPDMAAAQAIGIKTAKLLDRDTYAPHRHNARAMTDDQYLATITDRLIQQGKTPEQAQAIIEHSALGTDRSAAVQALMKRHAAMGNPLQESEAQHILDTYVLPNAVFRSGSLEHERLSSVPPIDDGRIAWTVKISQDARRLAQAAVWGPNYEKAYAMLDAIKEEGGPRAYEFARRTFDLAVGRTQDRLPDWLTGLMDWQSAKLSLSVISNMTQVPLNLPVRVGFKDTALGLLDFLRQDRPLRAILGYNTDLMAEHAREAGAIITGAMNDFKDQGMQALYPKEAATTLLGKTFEATGNVVKDFSTRLFNYVETANRAISQRAGERYFWTQVERLGVDAEDAVAYRRLQEMFPSPQAMREIAHRAQNGDDGLLNELALVAGRRISNETQFVTNPSTRPLFMASPAGRALGQFKQFTLQQANFLANEIMAFKHSDDPARTIRALALTFTVFPAVASAAVLGREWLMGKSVTSEKLHQAFKDPNFANIISAGVTAMLTTGTMGIMGDAVGTAMLGNKSALDHFLTPPTFSTAINTLEAGASAVKAAGMGVTGQPGAYKEAEHGIRAVAREFGGIGASIIHKTLGPTR